MIDEEKLLSGISDAVKACFEDCRIKAADTRITGYSIYSSDTGDIFTPIASTEKGARDFVSGSKKAPQPNSPMLAWLTLVRR